MNQVARRTGRVSPFPAAVRRSYDQAADPLCRDDSEQADRMRHLYEVDLTGCHPLYRLGD